MKYSLKKFSLLAFFILLAFTSTVHSQGDTIILPDSTSAKQSKWKFGMGFGLNFVGGTNISLSPTLLRSVSEKVAFGAGLQYNYAAIKDVRKTTTIGGNLTMFYYPSKKIITLLEFAKLNVSSKNETPEGEIKDSFWESALFVGAGLNVTNKITIGAKYNMLYKEGESVYTTPVIPFVNISF